MTTPGQLLSLPGWDNMNNMNDLSLQSDLMMDFRSGLPNQMPGQNTNLPLKKRSYAEMNTPMDNNATTYGDFGGLKKLNFLDNILEQTKVNTQLAGVDSSQFLNNPFGNFPMLQSNAKGTNTQKPKKMKKPAKKQLDTKTKKTAPKRNPPKKVGKTTAKKPANAVAKSPAAKTKKPAAKKTSSATSTLSPSAGKRTSASTLTPKGAAAKRTSNSKNISPRNGAKKVTKKPIAIADSRDISDFEKRERKNEREKQRRLLVNQQFNRLSELLGLPKERSTDKVTILAKAVKALESFQGSFMSHQLGSDQTLSIPF